MAEPTTDPPVDVLDTGRAGGLVMRGGIYRTVGFGIGSLLASVSVVVLTRHLGVARYGRYATIIALATLVTQLAEGGLTGLATRDYSVTPVDRRSKLMSDRLGLQLATSLLAVLVCAGLALAAGYDRESVWATVAAAVGLALAAVQLTVAVPLISGLRFGVTSALELLRQALLVALTVGLVAVGAHLLPFLVALIPSSLVALALTWRLVAPEVAIRPTFDPRAWSALARPALVISLSFGIATIYLFTTQIVTSLVASPTQTGLFAASLRVYGVAASVPGLVVTATLPLLARAARDDLERLRYAMQRLFEVAVIVGTAMTVLLVAGARPIIAVIAGHRFSGSVLPLQIEGFAVLGTCLTPVFSTGLLALHRHSALLWSNVAVLLVSASLALGLAPTIGARGAAIATLAAEATAAVALLFALARHQRALLPRGRRVVVRVAIAGAASLATLLLPIGDVARLALAAVVYTALVLLLGALPRELLELVPAAWRRGPLALGDATQPAPAAGAREPQPPPT